MMGSRQEAQAALFCKFSLVDRAPDDHLGFRPGKFFSIQTKLFFRNGIGTHLIRRTPMTAFFHTNPYGKDATMNNIVSITPNLIALFGQPEIILEQAAQYLMEQLNPNRLIRIRNTEEQLCISLRCSSNFVHQDQQDAFLEVSSHEGHSKFNLICEAPEDILKMSTPKALNYVEALIAIAAEAHEIVHGSGHTKLEEVQEF